MKLILDEMWPPAIAEQLRQRGHDAIAAQEAEHLARYSAIADQQLFERAQQDQRTVVTDNIADYEPLVTACETAGVQHYGVVFCSSRQFDRSDPRTVGRIVAALHALLTDQAKATTPFNRRHWLRRAG